ncbi:MAG TPA: tRNA (adenosine(37)-N6)-threonylcarbamoyltransferase complex ATPase subunit type 1 TsaE [bacterium]|nr:tRNA (adenosine(37)-N6)-threonylcarbamoyltransferase complex ATPase subunit type 1 TsaE [bacterium]
MQKKYISSSEKETKNIAKKIAANFTSGMVLGLIGNLGSGKTQFAKGVGEYFKTKKPINSPTFVLIKLYAIAQPAAIKTLVHIDCYRLQNPQELLDLGFQEILANKDNLVIIEWADKIKDILPLKAVFINFEYGKLPDTRKIIIQKPHN